jgi:ribosomal protein L11 methyltransferase
MQAYRISSKIIGAIGVAGFEQRLGFGQPHTGRRLQFLPVHLNDHGSVERTPMFSLEIECPPERQDLLVAELWEEGSAGIVETAGGLRAFFEDAEDRAALISRFGAVSWRAEEERDWVAESRANWEPLVVGQRFFLVPEWRGDPAPEGRFRIVVNPGMAFGTGRHETTQLCLEALERYLRPDMRVLDVGTGSGILAEAARLLGAAPVWACDNDPEAVAVAAGNIGPGVFAGSVDAVRNGVANIVIANISPEANTALLSDLLGSLRAGGVALLSGFEGQDVAAIASAAARLGGSVLELCRKGDWALLVVRGKLVGGVSDVRE